MLSKLKSGAFCPTALKKDSFPFGKASGFCFASSSCTAALFDSTTAFMPYFSAAFIITSSLEIPVAINESIKFIISDAIPQQIFFLSSTWPQHGHRNILYMSSAEADTPIRLAVGIVLVFLPALEFIMPYVKYPLINTTKIIAAINMFFLLVNICNTSIYSIQLITLYFFINNDIRTLKMKQYIRYSNETSFSLQFG